MKVIKAPKLSNELTLVPLKKDGEKYFVENFGNVAAGFPSPAEDFIQDRISIDEKYLSKIESTFIAIVGGMSGYPEYQIGDILILRSDYELMNDDDAVISINNSDYALKRIDTKKKLLYALNKDYAESVKIGEEDTVTVLGVVDAIVRDKGRKKRK